MEIAIRKATRLEYRPPKPKHIQTLINLTFHKPALIDEMLVTLARRGRENSWIIIYKVLIIVHTLIRQGNGDQTLSRLEKHTDVLSIQRLKEKASAYASIQNLHLYHDYLVDRVEAYRLCQIDYIKSTSKHQEGPLRHLPVAQGLLRETTVVQRQIGFCLSCKFQMDIGDNAINFNAYRLVVEDLLGLFQVVNEAVMNILEHYFTMTQTDARLALEIYKRFAQQTQEITEYLDNARKIQNELSISIPKLNHAPLSLASALEEYLNDDAYEHRRQSYIQEKQKEKRGSISNGKKSKTKKGKKEGTMNHYLNILSGQSTTQTAPIFPINTHLKRSTSMNINPTTNMMTSTLTMSPTSTGITGHSPTFNTNPFRFSTLPRQQQFSTDTPTSSSYSFDIHNNTRNPFLPSSSSSSSSSNRPLTMIQPQSTNPFGTAL
ncbi:ANTH domain-containing protein [Halteromyces radiatus]|uniref:ANTH domain-containing protein n=1 Tax=Halteromyces radiatus TaxID=101107 RepID=UPI00221E78A8|nr:ANTH domain-containing protein [Halteromyces radiatus]KAI8089034.1 ANTH domain-containing protein [Halteromyces radiatus]